MAAVRRWTGAIVAGVAMALVLVSSSTAATPSPVVAATGRPGTGYWTVAADGTVVGRDAAPFYGSMGGRPLNQPMVGLSSTATGRGYWTVAKDGGIFTFGDAGFFGSTGNRRLNKPVFSMAPTATNRGYWLVASDGGIFSFGDAQFYGSAGADRLTSLVVAILATPSGNGYWLILQDGTIKSYGDATSFAKVTTSPGNPTDMVVGAAHTATGRGLWLAKANGRVAIVGDATPYGDQPSFASDTVAIAAASDDSRYWLVGQRGQTASFNRPAWTLPAVPSDASALQTGSSPYFWTLSKSLDPAYYEDAMASNIKAAGWTTTGINRDPAFGRVWTAAIPGYDLRVQVTAPQHNVQTGVGKTLYLNIGVTTK